MLRNVGGFTLVEILLTVTVVGIIAATAMPALSKSRAISREASTIGTLRALNGAQATFAASCAPGYYAPAVKWLTTPPSGKAPSLGAEFAAGDTVTRQGYTIQFTSGPAIAAAPKSCNGLAAGTATQTYFLGADPLTVGPGYGTRHFGTISSGSIFQSVKRIGVFYTGSAPAPATPLK